jgi:hypothetical protein
MFRGVRGPSLQSTLLHARGHKYVGKSLTWNQVKIPRAILQTDDLTCTRSTREIYADWSEGARLQTAKRNSAKMEPVTNEKVEAAKEAAIGNATDLFK